MAQDDFSSAQEALSKIQAIEAKPLEELPFEFFDKPANKTTKLIANSGSVEPIKGKAQAFSYQFKEPVFLISVEISTTGYSDLSEFEFSAIDIFDEQFQDVLKPDSGGECKIALNRLVKTFSFTPPSNIMAVLGINSGRAISFVKVVGFPVARLEEYLAAISEVSLYKNKIISYCQQRIEEAAKADLRISDINGKIQQGTDQIDQQNKDINSLSSEVGKLTSQREAIVAGIEGLKREEEVFKEKVKSARGQAHSAEEHLLKLQHEISSSESKLLDLQESINIFPTEIEGFVDQGAQNLNFYAKFAGVSILGLLTTTAFLLINAEALTRPELSGSFSDVAPYLLMRLPYSILMLSIIAAFYAITHFMVSEAVRINRQRLNLAKIALVAKQVVDGVSSSVLDLSPQEKADLHVQVKMDMLRNHLRHYLSEDFYTNADQFSLAGIKRRMQSSMSDLAASERTKEADTASATADVDPK